MKTNQLSVLATEFAVGGGYDCQGVWSVNAVNRTPLP